MVHDCVLALGFFDGIHLGHAALLDRTRQRAQALGLTPAALSFDTHPDTLVFGTAVPLLNTMAERELLMRRLCGMERVIFAHFDEAMMHMPWQVFVEDYLVRQLHAKHVVCGHDFHFGDRGQGDPARLQEKCRELGIGCDVIPEIRVDGSAVSSTRIRRLLQTGRCEEAVRLLGHGQLVTGRVTRGAGRGAGLGFPTANVPFAPGVLVPAFGVYRAEAEVDGVRYACSYVELGNPGIPHAVVPYHDLKNADENELRELGRAIRWYSAFPKGANVNFYEITGEDRIFERTFERGVEDFTYACGTGTGSLVTVLTLQGKVSGHGVKVDMTGGQLIIDAQRDHSRIASLYLTGPTNIVCKGEVTDEDLVIPGM